VCACSSQSWEPCQSNEAGGKVVGVCRWWDVSSNSRRLCGFGSVCEISSSVDEVGVGLAIRVGSVW